MVVECTQVINKVKDSGGMQLHQAKEHELENHHVHNITLIIQYLSKGEIKTVIFQTIILRHSN